MLWSYSLEPRGKHCDEKWTDKMAVHFMVTKFKHCTVELQGSNTDGSFTMAVSNSFLRPYELIPIVADLG